MEYPLATATWDADEYTAIQRVVSSGNFTMGDEVRHFEESFSGLFGSANAVMSNSGSSANLLALAAIRFSSLNPKGSRDEVIVPTVSWSTTYYPVAQLGFKLRFVDVDIDTLNASVDSIAQAIGPRTAGILVVNLLGNPSELLEIRNLADEHGLFMIEDNCESMGAKYQGRFAGTFGDIGTFSTFFSHHISTMEGGVSVTDSLELKQIMTSLRAHGWTRELPEENFVHNKTGDSFDDLFRFVLPGYNLRPLELEGAIGTEQLRKVQRIVEGRRENAFNFLHLLSNYPELKVQREVGESSWFGFSLIIQRDSNRSRKDLVDAMRAHSIAVRPIVAGNFTKNPVLRHLNHVALEATPNADLIHTNGLFIGNHHYPMEQEFVLLQKAIEQFLSS